ncbi:hypothetical protein FKP32DRAFT_1605992 [Trametes sanguinea]|nr:hypothetical protein FKP32DRAFT_1605992 [Trametes sanguinea]
MPPTIADLAIHFERTVERVPPTLWAPLTRLPRHIPYSSLINEFSDTIRVCPPSTIGPIERFNARQRYAIPLYIDFPLGIPSREEPWKLSSATPDALLWKGRIVFVPFIGEAIIADFVDVSPVGATLVLTPTDDREDTIFIRVSRDPPPSVRTRKISEFKLKLSRSMSNVYLSPADPVPITDSHTNHSNSVSRLKKMVSFQSSLGSRTLISTGIQILSCGARATRTSGVARTTSSANLKSY